MYEVNLRSKSVPKDNELVHEVPMKYKLKKMQKGNSKNVKDNYN